MGALCAFLLVACYYDEKYRRIPNGLLLIMLLFGFIRNYFDYGGWGIPLFLSAGLMLVVLLYPLFKIGTLGAGDIKLFGICSGYLSFDKILYFLFFSMLIAAIFSLIKLVTTGNAKERLYYLGEYILQVVQSGKWSMYIKNKEEGYKTGIPLASSILGSLLLYMGGVY